MGKPYEYWAGQDRLVGYRAHPDNPNGAGLLIAPAFAGLRDFEMEQADLWAAKGYDVLALDYYGDGWRTNDSAEAATKMAGVQADRALFLTRLKAGLAQLDTPKVGAFGFCLGGKAVLDLARAGCTDAVVALHGVYDRPASPTQAMPPVLLCHGWNDPLATPSQFEAMVAELETHSPDWHALTFGQTGHAFTNPANTAGADNMGYVAQSARRTWAATEAFLAEHLLG